MGGGGGGGGQEAHQSSTSGIEKYCLKMAARKLLLRVSLEVQ